MTIAKQLKLHYTEQTMKQMESTRYTESRRITLMGAGKNALLALLKIIFGITGHSHALLADGVHSLSDLFIDALVLVASRVGSKAADSDHPYGHARIETAAIVALAMLLMFAGFGIIWDAGHEVFGARVVTKPSFYVFLVALFSMVINEVLYHYTRRAGKKINSNLLVTNAWHHRSDSATSVVVLIGVAAAWFGFGKFDALAAVIVGVMIINMAWQFSWSSIRELVDTGLDDALLEKITNTIAAVSGVRAIHQLRTRLMGGRIFLDVHILVDSAISVSEGHYIGHQVHFNLAKAIAEIADVTVHVDPEDDEVVAPSRHLPNRQQLIALLKQRWQGERAGSKCIVDYLDNVTVHYLGGKLYMELHLPLAALPSDSQQLQQRLQQAVQDIPTIVSVKVLFGNV